MSQTEVQSNLGNNHNNIRGQFKNYNMVLQNKVQALEDKCIHELAIKHFKKDKKFLPEYEYENLLSTLRGLKKDSPYKLHTLPGLTGGQSKIFPFFCTGKVGDLNNPKDIYKGLFICKQHNTSESYERENKILKFISRERKKDYSSIDLDLLVGKDFIINHIGSNDKKNYLYLEYLAPTGGYKDLFKVITNEIYAPWFRNITTCLRIFKNILLSVKFLHHIGVCHGDIKAENIMLCQDKTIKLIDFGGSEFSKIRGKKKMVRFKYGTGQFVAPEVYRCTFVDGPKCDLWSLGVLLYVMHTCSTPFTVQDPTSDICFKRIKEGNMLFTRDFSDLIKPIVRGLMTYDPLERIDIETALQMTQDAISESKLNVMIN
jgi:serine/threonine protein kinase